MNLRELKTKTPAELLLWRRIEIENAGAMRKQEMMFAILKSGWTWYGHFRWRHIRGSPGWFRLSSVPSPSESNYLAGPDDIYVSPSQVENSGLRTGDTVEGEIRSPKEGERYFALLKVNKINFEEAEKTRHRIGFDN